MGNDSIVSKIDFSQAAKFMSDAVRIAYEHGRLMDEEFSYLDFDLVTDSDMDESGVVLYKEIDSIVLKKFFSEKNSEYSKSICSGYHKIFIKGEGNFSINTDNKMVVIDDERKFYYIKDGKSFDLSFFDDCWFYVLLIPSQP